MVDNAFPAKAGVFLIMADTLIIIMYDGGLSAAYLSVLPLGTFIPANIVPHNSIGAGASFVAASFLYGVDA